jgi:cell wall-associated NlpC family hydrolase
MCFARLAILLPLFLCASGRNDVRVAEPGQSAKPDRVSNAPGVANAVLFRALALVGTRYRYGGNTPESGFDCSGLVGYVFRDAAGIGLPRTSAELGKLDRPEIPRASLRGGDLVLFASDRKVSHVGIYVGNGRFVHAPNSGGTVRLDSLDAPGWRDSFRSGKRVIR